MNGSESKFKRILNTERFMVFASFRDFITLRRVQLIPGTAFVLVNQKVCHRAHEKVAIRFPTG